MPPTYTINLHPSPPKWYLMLPYVTLVTTAPASRFANKSISSNYTLRPIFLNNRFIGTNGPRPPSRPRRDSGAMGALQGREEKGTGPPGTQGPQDWGPGRPGRGPVDPGHGSP